jgi:DNA-binding response OmpR family regulator
LLVDGDRPVRSLVKSLLTRRGYEVIEAASGEEAWSIFREQFSGIALLLTDIMMPGLSGPDLAELVHGIQPSMPVLFMSGYCGEFASKLKGCTCIQKPFHNEELLARVIELLRVEAQ